MPSKIHIEIYISREWCKIIYCSPYVHFTHLQFRILNVIDELTYTFYDIFKLILMVIFGIFMLPSLYWHLDFIHFPNDLMWFSCYFSMNIFRVIVLMSIPFCQHSFTDLSAVLHWQISLIIFMTKI